VIVAGATLVAIDAANTNRDTTSISVGLGDLPTLYPTVSNASGSLRRTSVSADGTADAFTGLAYNSSCLVGLY
jgi:hypothetical protein